MYSESISILNVEIHQALSVLESQKPFDPCPKPHVPCLEVKVLIGLLHSGSHQCVSRQQYPVATTILTHYCTVFKTWVRVTLFTVNR